MTGTILDRIIERKRQRLSELKRSVKVSDMERHARNIKVERGPNLLLKALSDHACVNVIAEFKKASPSKGDINTDRDPAATAVAYQAGGAAAISVLTEEDFFRGGLGDLKAVRAATELPILRKDFVIDEIQVYESAAAGADAILLIVAAVTAEDLHRLYRCADSLGLDTVIEVHNRTEMETAVAVGAKIIGVNNRDLKTFDVSLDVSRQLVTDKPMGTVMIAESGITSAGEILELRARGFDGFLVGESLMRSGDPEAALKKLVSGALTDVTSI